MKLGCYTCSLLHFSIGSDNNTMYTKSQLMGMKIKSQSIDLSCSAPLYFVLLYSLLSLSLLADMALAVGGLLEVSM